MKSRTFPRQKNATLAILRTTLTTAVNFKEQMIIVLQWSADIVTGY